MENFNLRAGLAIFGIVLSLLWVSPNIIDTHKISWLPQRKLNYGLDIQGGLHLVMGVDVPGVVSESVSRLAAAIKAELLKEGIVVDDVKPVVSNAGELQVIAGSDAKLKATHYLEDKYAAVLQKVADNDKEVNFRYLESHLLDQQGRVIHQAIETIRNRIDEFGVAEPSISQQGSDRILVQLPGMADAEKAKSLINATAKLDFMLVIDDKGAENLSQLIADAETKGQYNMKTLKYGDYLKRLNEDLKGKIPEKSMVLFEKAANAQTLEAGHLPVLVNTQTELGGSDLDDAFVNFDQMGFPVVDMRFNAAGANKFKLLTGANVNKRMAIVLDKVVKSAPNIREEIGGGTAQISLGGAGGRDKAMDEAKMISTSLRAGALPASLEQMEERRVGPSLGADAIKKAQFAGLMGAALILVFMFLRYKTMGLISDIALLINILGVFALLTSFGATLTLPGIAGIALTVGFAVDANVLINERMREELGHGSSVAMAIREGYARAMSAILDSNITTAATACVLLYFGTGPVRGFAVTLLIGIATTLFANVFVSKVIVDFAVNKLGLKKISV